jgi:hypothetical protein
MPDTFTVPQFLDAEDRLLGVSMRQFIILLATLFMEMILYRLIPTLGVFIAFGLPVLVIGVSFAFIKINGAPLHYFMLNLIMIFKRPRLRVWDRRYSNADLKELMKQVEAPPPPPAPKKAFAASSKLQELSLVVNTGGVYRPEE